MRRRHFLKTACSALAFVPFAAAANGRPTRRILLRSSWASVNIGDIAHTPGMLRLIEENIPGCEVTLWPTSVENGVAELLTKRFPKLKILGSSAAEKEQVFATHDFLLHGSGPNLGGARAIAEWSEQTGKPYGIAGITWFRVKDDSPKLISGARFAFFRDSVSLQTAKDVGMNCPIMEYGPDATFACDLTNEAGASTWLKEVGLETGKFMCCIPRLRVSPYWEMKPGVPFNEKSHARNEEMKEHDNGPLRDTVVAVVRKTGLKVLLCPEDSSQMKVNKELIYDRLPSDVKEKVVWRKDYWLTDFATSVYQRSAGLFGNEQHSPILCVANGIPAVVCRFKEQSSKGIMWRDIGLGEWLLNHDLEEPQQRLTATVLAIANDPEGAKARTRKAKAFVDERMKHMMDTLRIELDRAGRR
jgi:hypothetical protein